jgi:hypothetical protein
MNKYIIGAIILAVLIVGFAFAGGDGRESAKIPEAVASELTLESDFYEFGDIDIFGGKVETNYVVRNSGNEDVTVTSALTSCMCTEGVIENLSFGMHGSSGGPATIPAGESKIVTAIFDPLAHGPEGTGPITRELFLETNSSVTPQLTLRFGGNVVKN